MNLTLFFKLVFFFFCKHEYLSTLSCSLLLLHLLVNVQNIYIHNILDTIIFPQKHKKKIKSCTSGISSNLVSNVITISRSPGLNSSTPVFPQNSLLSLGSTRQCRNCFTSAPLDRVMWSSMDSPSLKKKKKNPRKFKSLKIILLKL